MEFDGFGIYKWSCDKPIDNIVMDKPMEYSNGLPMDLPIQGIYPLVN